MVDIVPAILPKSFGELADKLRLIKGFAPVVQIDVCDGKFVPSKTWPYVGDEGEWRQIATETEGLPFWRDFNFEIDLMVLSTDTSVNEWIRAGAARLVFHIEAAPRPDILFNAVSGRVEIAMAINIDTDINLLQPFIGKIAAIQCMGIAIIGFQGQQFDERVLAKIASLRKENPALTISVDGGVNLESAPALVAAGANRLVVGSALFESGNIRDTLETFRAL